MMQIVGAPCVKAGPGTNGKHPAVRLRSTVDGMVVNDVYMSPFFIWVPLISGAWGVDVGTMGFQQAVEHRSTDRLSCPNMHNMIATDLYS